VQVLPMKDLLARSMIVVTMATTTATNWLKEGALDSLFRIPLPLYQMIARPIPPWELGDSLVVLRTNKGKDMDINNVCELMNK